MKICLILLMIALSGCTTQARKPEPMPVPVLMVEQEIDRAIWHVINELVRARYTWQAKEIDPFRRQ
jgi:hypothetical protein